ncbi:RmlC-like cupin [Karstenula rhodostoma CBS 690.94]|uniref:RmlC-like cupin n=1 Tax=Karstenula rhodostoma CBS 690.94 TaxID=1392251 RepID=A0A9P4PM83_9PLEO|nr:RmlC-like cupin [Karstenula rhodostoma CBS 690.94]
MDKLDKTVNQDLVSRLKLAATVYDKHQILAKDEDWMYDFNSAHPTESFKPGSVKNANAATFPAMVGHGMTIAQLNLGPCAMLPAHYHPRATNMVIAITGNTTTWMVNENGVRTVSTTLTPGKMTIFPLGSIHSMQNNGCDDAYLISALNSEDTGTMNIAGGLWSIRDDMIRAAFGNPTMDVQATGKNIPGVGTGSVYGSDECMKRCGMSKGKA